MKTKRKTSGAKPEIRCPACGALLPHQWVRRAGGRLAGAITGSRKAHPPEVARAAALARWAKAKHKHE